jgi:hypothetical protein
MPPELDRTNTPNFAYRSRYPRDSGEYQGGRRLHRATGVRREHKLNVEQELINQVVEIGLLTDRLARARRPVELVIGTLNERDARRR